MKHVDQNGPFFSGAKLTEKMSYIKSVSRENPKFVDFASVQVKHIVENRPFLSLMPSWMKKWVIFDTMAYQELLKYHISFSLFKVSEPWQFQELITLEDGGGYDMMKYHFSLILKLCLRGGWTDRGNSSLGKITLNFFWLQITSHGSIFPENLIGNWASIADLY